MGTPEPLEIVHISPELSPWAKAGGLADMVAALTKNLAFAGCCVRIVCPFYAFLKNASIRSPALPKLESLENFSVQLGSEKCSIKAFRCQLAPQLELYLLGCGDYFERVGLYGDAEGSYADNPRRFAVFTLAALELARAFKLSAPSLLHLHDWTLGLAPALLKAEPADSKLYKVPCVFTIHNLRYQGPCSPSLLEELGETTGAAEVLKASKIPKASRAPSFMRLAILHADMLGTVSPSYAREILTMEFGCGLEDLLGARRPLPSGILNGIDTDIWNPETDPALKAPYSACNPSGKAVCKADLQAKLGLEASEKLPLMGCVARLYRQKGIDWILEALPELFEATDMQLVVLGQGDAAFEAALMALSKKHTGRFALHLGYDETLAHQIEAAADFFLMPSRFEPCGLNQMYSMRYGALPIVHKTGGLADSVEPRGAQHAGSGWHFKEPSAIALAAVVREACELWNQSPASIAQMRQNAMRRDFSWAASTKAYLELYQQALNAKKLKFGVQ